MTHPPDAIPWRDWMKLGLGVLRFSPDVFWRMSLAEWLAARDGIMGGGGQTPADSPVMAAELEHLIKSYPDWKGDRW